MATIRECNRALKLLPEFAKDQAQRTIDTTAFQISRLASQKAPRRTGRLQEKITWKSRPRSVSAIVAVESEAFYWKYLEYGTVHLGARPFLRPAAEAMATDHDQRMIQGLERALTQMEREAR
jgi:HK97 gp10 family phage protein